MDMTKLSELVELQNTQNKQCYSRLLLTLHEDHSSTKRTISSQISV